MKTETRHVASAAFDCTLCGARLDAEHVDVAADGAHCTFCGATQREATQFDPGVSLDVGGTLHDARLTRGETLEQASHFTHIQIPYLRALEHDQASAFDPFPGTPESAEKLLQSDFERWDRYAKTAKIQPQ